MGSNVKKMTVFMIIMMFAAVIGIVWYDNKDSLKKTEEVTAELGAEEQAVSDNAAVQSVQIGDDTRAFLTDETFFDQDKQPYSSIQVVEENSLSLLMTSVEKDLRIQIVDNSGEPVVGEAFRVILNKKDEYVDEDQDGVIYIEQLRSGDYSVALEAVDGYRVPSTEATITVKQNVEYVAIEDIQLLILSEKDINPEQEDLEIKGAEEDADKSEIKKIQGGNESAKFGIDVSKWNKEIDWDKVKKAGVEYAIIRLGYRGATTGALIEDPYFEKNIMGASAAGVPVGVYFFTQAVNEVEAVEEASMVIRLCQDYDIEYPVFIDSESTGGNGRADGLDVDMRTRVCAAFCQTIENAGYRAGVYASRNWFNEMLDVDRLDDYIVWLAEYRDAPLYQGYYHMWQYTSNGSVDGIEGRVDFNLSYLKADDLVLESEVEDDEESEESEDSGVGVEVVEDLTEDEDKDKKTDNSKTNNKTNNNKKNDRDEDETDNDKTKTKSSSTSDENEKGNVKTETTGKDSVVDDTRTTATEVAPRDDTRTTAVEVAPPVDNRTYAQ